MREFLKGLDLDKETIDTIMAEHGKLMTSNKEALGLANEKIKATEEALKRFDGIDVEKLQGEIETLRTDLASKDTEHQTKIAEMTFNNGLSAAIAALKGKNAKAVTAMLDVEALKGSKNQETDIKAALEALKESDGYLFESEQAPSHYASGTGSNKMLPPAEKDQIMQAAKEAMQIK